MISKKIALPGIIAICLVQIFVMGSLIVRNEITIVEGAIYKFQLAPIDPHDPFRGKYITLQFDINMLDVSDSIDWKSGQKIFGVLSTDSSGFARILEAYQERPSADLDYVTVYVSGSMESYGKKRIFIDLPFNRFYLPEAKATKAEEAYESATQDPQVETYALVSVKDGQAVVTDVLIGDKSITELLD